MDDISIRIEGRAGRITLQRPDALNALTYDMALAIEAALSEWRSDDHVELVLIEGAGERAFCAGGDIQEMYRTGMAGDFAYGRRFWADEYRLNALIAGYSKPFIAFAHGFTMGGGVGVSLHGSHRIVNETSQIAMPECGIGLVPDVGGSLLLARAPGRLGEYFGLTGARMGPGDAIRTKFADSFVPGAAWHDLKSDLIRTGDVGNIKAVTAPPPDAESAAHMDQINHIFGAQTLSEVFDGLTALQSEWAEATLKLLNRPSPLSLACALRLIRNSRMSDGLTAALAGEYRFTYRCMEHGDFLEGIRAQVIDKDRNPNWRHKREDVTDAMVLEMLAHLGEDELSL